MKKVIIPTKLDPICKKMLEDNGNYTVFQEEGADLFALAAEHSDAYAFVVRSEKITPEVIDAYPNLGVVIRAGAGYNTIDTDYARSKGIDVMNTPGANSNAVAEEVLALMMAHARHLIPADASCRSGLWEKSKFMGGEITGKTLGILGLGHIGQLLVKRASGFEMTIIGFDPVLSKEKAAAMGVELVASVEDVFSRADYISLHIPENDHTRGMINASLFDVMKPGAVIVNCARAGVLNEDDLRTAKASKDIYYLNDVYPKDEAGDKPVAEIADIMLPHLGASTREANSNAAQFAARQLIEFDEKGITHAIVNRDTPVGLDVEFSDLAYTLTRFCHAGFRSNQRLKLAETSAYGGLKPFANWLVVPIVCAIDEHFSRSLDWKGAERYLSEQGIDYVCREVDDQKAYENSITIDLTASGDNGDMHHASVRGTVTEGNMMISRINNFDKLYIEPSGNMCCFIYDDRPGVLAEISTRLASAGINIDDVRNPHSDCGKKSIALMKVNQAVPCEVIAEIEKEIDASVAFQVDLG